MTFNQAKRASNAALKQTKKAHLVVQLAGTSYEVVRADEFQKGAPVYHVSAPEKFTISISPGNDKMGHIPSISFPPAKTCAPKKRPCLKPKRITSNGSSASLGCYAARMLYRMPKLQAAWERNWAAWNFSPETYWPQLEAGIRQLMPSYFRFFVGGDVPNQAWFNNAAKLASDLPETRFMMFTKTYADGIVFTERPANLSVVLSVWPGMELPGVQYNGMPRAYVDLDDRRPENAVTCAGTCWACAACWGLADKNLDVVLHHH